MIHKTVQSSVIYKGNVSDVRLPLEGDAGGEQRFLNLHFWSAKKNSGSHVFTQSREAYLELSQNRVSGF